jgi:DNA-binding NarL/FixJ family response regulator
MKRLFIVGTDSFVIHAMRFALEYAPDANLFGMMHGRGRVRDVVRRAQPDVVIVDGSDRAYGHGDRLAEIREEAPDALLVLLAGPLDESALRVALDTGTVICMPPSLRPRETEAQADARPGRSLVAAIAREPVHPALNTSNGSGPSHVANGVQPPAERCPLTAREREILCAVAQGHTNARIGRELWVTEQTVKFHLSNIYRKLGVSNRTEASRYALMNGLAGGQSPTPAGADDLTPGRWSRSSPSALAGPGLKTA